MWGMTNVNRVYPCLSCLKYNEVHKGPSAGTWACDFTDCHMPITFIPYPFITLSLLTVIGKGHLIKMCFVCLLSLLSCCNDIAFPSQQAQTLRPRTMMEKLLYNGPVPMATGRSLSCYLNMVSNIISEVLGIYVKCQDDMWASV